MTTRRMIGAPAVGYSELRLQAEPWGAQALADWRSADDSQHETAYWRIYDFSIVDSLREFAEEGDLEAIDLLIEGTREERIACLARYHEAAPEQDAQQGGRS